MCNISCLHQKYKSTLRGIFMRIKVGQIVDIDKEVSLRDLTPLDRIIASCQQAYRNTKFYQRRYAQTQEKLEQQQHKVKEVLFNNLLGIISEQLRDNKLLAEKDDVCESILIEVPARFEQFLREVISMKEFLPYEVTIVEPNKLVQKFAKVPCLLHISNRELT